MIKKAHYLTHIPSLVLLLALVILAIEPALWLIQTWQDEAYDSAGFWVFLLVLGIFVWSLRSTLINHTTSYKTQAFVLLGLTAAVRLVGQVLAVNSIGALALVIDVYALALLLGVANRQRALSPLWLAVLFVFALPVERIIQRVAGYGLQELSASVSCFILQQMTDAVSCAGTRIAMDGQQFLIDLPCAGTNSLVLLLVFSAVLMTLARPDLWQGFSLLLFVPLLAIASNVLRILALVFGATSDVPKQAGIDVMLQPWHDIVGLLVLLPALLLILWFALRILRSQDGTQLAWPPAREPQRVSMKLVQSGNTLSQWLFPIIALIMAVTIILQPKTPVDVSRITALPTLPVMLQGHYAQTVPLLKKEQAYFTQFGGYARKAIYGERQLLLSKTSSPLRHLHAPDECLRGLGFKVSYLGSIDTPVPSAVYRAESPTGRVWKVAVSFVSDSGQVATNVSAAVWEWLNQRYLGQAQQWFSIQRISPWETDFKQDRQWDRDLFNALEGMVRIRLNSRKES